MIKGGYLSYYDYAACPPTNLIESKILFKSLISDAQQGSRLLLKASSYLSIGHRNFTSL